jgi:hypothetical protein
MKKFLDFMKQFPNGIDCDQMSIVENSNGNYNLDFVGRTDEGEPVTFHTEIAIHELITIYTS